MMKLSLVSSWNKRHLFLVRTIARLAMAALLTIVIPVSARAQQQYLFGVLPTFPVTITTPSAIALDVNDSGMVVGQSRLDTTVGAGGPCSAQHPENCLQRAYSWTRAGGMIPIPPVPGDENASSNAQAVNNAGQIVGTSGVAGSSHAFLWTSAGGTTDLGVLGSSGSAIPPSAIAIGLNNTGMVVGASTTTMSHAHAFVWTAGGGMVDIGSLGGATTTSFANDVNDAGVVVGSTVTAGGPVHAFVWTSGGGMVDIETLGSTESRAFRINSAGVVVGQRRFTDGNFHAFRWTQAGGMVDLGSLGVPTFGGPVSMATGINDSGQIVGTTTVSGLVGLRPFSWTPAGGMVAIISEDPGSTFAQPSAINNIGNVVGSLFGIGPSPTNAVIWRAPQEDLVMDLGAFGTWLRRGTVWSQLNPLGAKSFGIFREHRRGHDDVLIDFGPGLGLWVWLEDDTWFQLHPLSPKGMAVFDVNGDGDDDVVLSFPGYGLWWFNTDTGEWAQLHALDPSSFAAVDLGAGGGKKLVVDFPGYGLWTYSGGAWALLHPLDVTSMIATDLDGNGEEDLVVNFPTYGVWAYMNGATWTSINGHEAQHLAAGDLDGNGVADLVIDFGAGVGVWTRSNGTTWALLHPLSTENIVVADLDGNGKAEVIIDFGAPGLWGYEVGRGWQLIQPTSPGALATGNLH